MTYLVIHPNKAILEKELVRIVSKYLKNDVSSIEEIQDKPDFYIVQPKEEKESITIEQGKQLQKNLIYSPFQNKYQFGIILNSQLMTTQAQNSLLKTLEEKAENTILILTVNNEKAILETILSRCTRIYPQFESTTEEHQEDFSEEIDFIQKPIYEKIDYIENVIKQDRVEYFLEQLMRFFKTEYEIKIANQETYQKEIEALKTVKDVQFKISKNVNKKIALEHLCFELD